MLFLWQWLVVCDAAVGFYQVLLVGLLVWLDGLVFLACFDLDRGWGLVCALAAWVILCLLILFCCMFGAASLLPLWLLCDFL